MSKKQKSPKVQETEKEKFRKIVEAYIEEQKVLQRKYNLRVVPIIGKYGPDLEYQRLE